ncbi:cysteinyl-tRNA synthetase [Chloroflexota bacterium]
MLQDNERIPSPQKPPGRIALFGSGETSASGRRVYDWLLSQLPLPIRVAILETPAGFQPNSAIVAGKVGDFLRHHLQNYGPQITVVPARQKGTPFSTNDDTVITPVLSVSVIFLGPGSPTYAVNQLQDSLAWHTVLACHRQGATLVLASAATIASSAQALPVYEIYKAGEDLHWRPGLDLFRPYGLSLVFISHWNNKEGGAELDTSRCYMGQARFEKLLGMLPPDTTIVGIDEHTALVIDMHAKDCHIMGRGTVTLLRNGDEKHHSRGHTFPITELGPFQEVEPQSGIPPDIWQRVLSTRAEPAARAPEQLPDEILALVQSRENARTLGNWPLADTLRQQIFALGWQVNDTPHGPKLLPKDDRE